MGLHKHFLTFLIVIVSLTCFSTNSQLPNKIPPNYIRDEYGYAFEAYPSYFTSDEGVEFDNSFAIDSGISHLQKGIEEVKVSRKKSINVLNFGAKGDGKTDDTKAFEKAWEESCVSSQDMNIMIVVPQNHTFLLNPITFSGPCTTSHLTFQIDGVVLASNDRSKYKKDMRHWLLFDNIRNLVVKGSGSFDGNGDIWWQNSCKINESKPCVKAPTAVTFYKCTKLRVKDIAVQNAQQIHMSIEQCNNVEITNVKVNAPEKSPNTDGIHVTATHNLNIRKCVISTGDDCISIVDGSKKIRATDITCGPGHGISIGSLGSGNSEEYVSDVVVNRAKLSGTTNGVRIKTWQGGSGSASNIKFQNIQMQNVHNPIIIDQQYCDQDQPCKQQSSAVQVKNIVYKNIEGMSAANPSIKFDCSKSYPCHGILLQNVNLPVVNNTKPEALCNNVNLKTIGNVTPNCP
ncbi:polygalacturonase-like [Andrographis paniculata]|uniref:polygalacturonase-like n=1 Tax=Andrographis paniculata TaxID=175694 RepID=UPI0021E81DAB|nr:polygalacturonase-like [Andrographis paniculata]